MASGGEIHEDIRRAARRSMRDTKCERSGSIRIVIGFAFLDPLFD